MAFINHNFRHDIFVSYAHGLADRKGTGIKRLKFWSESLINELYGEIVDLSPKFSDLDIFIDDQLDPTEPLTSSIRKEVKGSGLLIIVMSEHYLQSVWCKDEREWFETEVERRGHEGGLTLVIRVQPTLHEKWPDFLKDERGHVVIGFKFHPNPKRPDELVQPYGWPTPLPEDRSYYKELGNLAGKVTHRLQEIKNNEALKIKARAPRVEIRIQGKPNIYLLAPNNTREEWKTIREKLTTAGYRVLPEVLPDVGSDLTKIQAFRNNRLKTLGDEAHALCLLRPTTAKDIDREIEAMFSDRINTLQIFDKDIPCAILNRGEESDLSIPEESRIETIDARSDNWLPNFHTWIKRVLEEGPSQ
jgi:hypothetical protein